MYKLNLLPQYQSSYLANFSTETLLLKLVDDILKGMEAQEVMALVALDLSAAFDMVDPNYYWSFSGPFWHRWNPLTWIKSYLDKRSFQVQVGSILSEPIDVPSAVPQGSLLGPDLFICYIATLENIIQNTTTWLLGYADDHAVYNSFLPIDEHLALENLSVVTNKIRNWMRHSFLKMNNSTMEIVICGTKNQCSKITTMAIDIGDTTVNISLNLTYLGVLLDQNLKLKSHILSKAKKASYHLYRIKQIIKFLDLPAKQTPISSLIMSHLDYTNAIFVNLPNSSIFPMQCVQNQAAKLVMNKHHLDIHTTIMSHLHWLPIKFRCEYKMLLQVYRCMKGQAPEYLQHKLMHKNLAWVTHSSTDCNLLQIPSNKRRTLADHGFSSAGSRLWNSSPLELGAASSVPTFK